MPAIRARFHYIFQAASAINAELITIRVTFSTIGTYCHKNTPNNIILVTMSVATYLKLYLNCLAAYILGSMNATIHDLALAYWHEGRRIWGRNNEYMMKLIFI